MFFGFSEEENSPENSCNSGDDYSYIEEEEDENPGNVEENKAFWSAQGEIFLATLRRTSSIESKIRQAAKLTLMELNSEGPQCQCRTPVAGGCRICLEREICNRLRNNGYNCAISKSKWKSSPYTPSGEHTYVEVIDNSDAKKGEVRVIIEPNFRAEFEIARASEDYKRLVNRLPEVFVGKSERLNAVIKILCSAAKKCMKEKKMHLGPWLKHRYMQAKWLGTYERTAPPPLPVRFSERQPKTKASMSITIWRQRLTSFSLLIFVSMTVLLSSGSDGSDSISTGQSLSGNQTLTSSGGVFQMGFFNPGNSDNYYIAIWYNPQSEIIKTSEKTVVWVANRNNPISDPTSSALKLHEDGNLVLLSPIHKVGQFYGAHLGYNKLNEIKTLTSWNSSENPAIGLYSAVLRKNGFFLVLSSTVSSNYWNTTDFASLPDIRFTRNIFQSNENESYLTYYAPEDVLTRIVLDETGQLQQYRWSSYQWRVVWRRPSQLCGSFGFSLCGNFSICNEQKAPICVCAPGFEPTAPKLWENEIDQTGGCQRKVKLQCNGGGKDSFILVPNIRYPFNSQYLKANSTKECQLECLSDCSCSAYFYDSLCYIWTGQVPFLREAQPKDPFVDFYFRVASLDRKLENGNLLKNRRTMMIVIGLIVVFFTFCGIVLAVIWRGRLDRAFESPDDHSLMLLKFQDLKKATKNFSEQIGQGGFGSVFKGTLPNSTIIAVKKLGGLTQSEKQFRAEVSTVGTIHHTNLVRLRGFCIYNSTRFLIYDYMPNGSLASYLFRKDCIILSWRTRYDIAIGIAKGLAYLHENCRDSIIHCDIKPENILLDEYYSPKVADFGLAQLVGRDFSRVLTTIRGTRGYLAPEWMSGVAITPKVDVFSYGKLLFEIISGRRNIGVQIDEMQSYFPAVVANALNKGEELEVLLDYKIGGGAKAEELSRACKVACWCIHDEEKHRPTMSQVIHVLEGVMDVGMPPIPQFFRWLEDEPVRATVYHEADDTSSGSY